MPLLLFANMLAVACEPMLHGFPISHGPKVSRASQQLHLFDAPRPLAERFGEGFFRAAPRGPGVYVMTGVDQRVLYIGQSKNLRARLAAYKNARPDRASRKVVRLVRAVTSITWEKCANARQARLRENQLLRRHRPKFNSLNTYPQAYSFIALRCEGNGVELCRMSQAGGSGGECLRAALAHPACCVYGVFKSRSEAAFGALLRLLWAAEHRPLTPGDFPLRLLAARAPQEFRFQIAESSAIPWGEVTQQLGDFLDGAGDRLLEVFRGALPASELLCPFQRGLHSADLEILAGFYRFGPRRNFELRRQHQIAGRLIHPEELDDLLVLDPTVVGERCPAAPKKVSFSS